MRSRITLLAAAMATALSAPVSAQFSNAWFFGDSLTDGGSFKPVLPSGTGLFTTNPGPVWSQVFAESYGFSALPANQGGTNYAYGGARVSASPGYPATAPTGAAVPIATQVSQYLAKGPADGSAIYSIWGGANDLFVGLQGYATGTLSAAQVQANLGTAATQLAGQVAALKAGGANYIIVWNLPDVGKTPSFATSPLSAQVTSLSSYYNSVLFSTLDATKVPVIRLDSFRLLNEVSANPAAYGFVSASVPACGTTPSLVCTSANFVAPNAAQTFVFADGVHPTTAGHKLLAQYATSVLRAPQQIGVLAEAPLAVEQAVWRSLEGRMISGLGGQGGGKFNAWANYDYGNPDLDSGFVTGNAKQDTLAAGGDIRISDSVLAGAAVAFSGNKGDFGGGGYKLNQTSADVYASYTSGPWYVGATLGGADLDYRDVHRDITLGTATRTESGETRGYSTTGRLLAGYWFRAGDWMHGPTAKFTYQDVKVRAFQERGSNSTTMVYDQQNRKSKVASIGWQATGQLGSFRPFARVSWENELNDDVRSVSAGVFGMNGLFSLPAWRPDNNYVQWALGGSMDFGRLTGYATASGTASKRDGDGLAFTIGVRVPL